MNSPLKWIWQTVPVISYEWPCTENVMKTWRYPRNLHLKEVNRHPFPDFPTLRCSIYPPACHVRSLPLLLSPFGSLPKQMLDHKQPACRFPWQLYEGAQYRSRSKEQRAWFRASPRALDAGRTFGWTRYPELEFGCRTYHTPLRPRILTCPVTQGKPAETKILFIKDVWVINRGDIQWAAICI